MICKKCGNKIEDNQKFCNQCGEAVTEEQPKKKSNVGIIIGIIAAILLLSIIAIAIIVVILIFVVRGGSEEPTSTTTTVTTTTASTLDDDKNKKVKDIDFTNISFRPEDNDDESKNIEFVKAYMNYTSSETASRYAYVGVINKNDKNVDIAVYINYYKDGVRIGSDYTHKSFIKPNVISSLEISLSPKDEYDKVDITYQTSPADTYMVDVPVNSNNYKKLNEDSKTEKIFGEFTNNTKKDIYGYATCIRYKNNEIVYLHPGHLGEVKPGKKGECTCYKLDLNPNLDYDKTECVLNNVYYTEGE